MIHDSESAPVSVVIPCFCSLATIGRALDSVLQQTVRPREVILVDDCSSDETPKFLRAAEKRHRGLVKIILLAKNAGAATARNAGWMIATQPYIAFLDADDSWHMNKLELQYALMKNRHDIALCGHQCVLYQNDGSSPLLPREWKETQLLACDMLFRSPFSTPSVMLRRDTSFRFEEGRRYGEDLLLWQRIAFAGHKVVRMEMPLAYVHKPLYGAGGLSQQLWKMEKGELSNLLVHYKIKNIGILMWVFSTIFSLIKFFRRVVVVRLSY